MNNFIKEFMNIRKEYLKNFSKILKWALQNYKISNSSLWANTLCYFTTLLFIPLLAIAFSVGRWFGIDHFYLNQLAVSSPLNQETINLIIETTQNLLNNTRSGLLAGVGFFSLAWVVISIFSIMERALNSIWGIKTQRTIFRKVTDYFTLFLLLPFCIIANNILGRFFLDIAFVGFILKFITPYLSLWLFFLFFYTILPNTKVNPKYSFISGFFIAFILNQSNLLLIKLQIFIGTYNKIYGSFSVLLLSLIWLKIIWFLILLGAHLSYILQNKDSFGQIIDLEELSFNSRLKLAKLLLFLLLENYTYNDPPLSPEKISEVLNLSIDITNRILLQFENMGYISKIDISDLNCYKLTINKDKITISKLYDDIKNYGLNI